ncbi:putative carbonic anhydrase 3 [Bradysia coprophila]|uniref:putative carbonic anhydrase 3 n=1 Tax=Bradysia coprophila TaxID=38358 RepID=UPI00187DB0DA|nr:putative carbonic anhydrase 3 [Bradysia coprophila]XP_037043406.1 putative carbonic anhydrase 3 [Bradysia coprophila]
MAHFKAVIFLIWLASPSLGLDNGQITHEEFCYEDYSCGPMSADWSGQCQSGERQSPIDLPYIPHRHNRHVDLEFNDLYCSDEFWIVDNGHTIQVTLETDPTSLARVSGYEFDYPYIFAQIHFHWGYADESGSEHSIDNEFYSMEAHLVHYDSKYANFSEAANSGDPKGLAVIAVFITEGHDWSHHTGFDTIAENIPQFGSVPTHIQKRIDLSTFLPRKGQHFYRYFGSLTTPMCNEAVEWTVVRDPIYVRRSLIKKFRQVRRSDNRRIGENHRPIQDVGNRLVQYLTKA